MRRRTFVMPPESGAPSLNPTWSTFCSLPNPTPSSTSTPTSASMCRKITPGFGRRDIRSAHAWMGGIVGPRATKMTVDKWVRAIKEDLKRRGMANEPLGIDVLDATGREALREAGIRTVNCSGLMADARAHQNRGRSQLSADGGGPRGPGLVGRLRESAAGSSGMRDCRRLSTRPSMR